jgi:sphingomyelin phosphodiesterase
VQALVPKFDYLIWSGDSPPHDVWNQSQAYNDNASMIIASAVTRHFPGRTVLFSVGNHEAFPVDEDQGPRNGSNAEMTAALAAAWSAYLPPDQVQTFRTGGFYTVCCGCIARAPAH